MIPYGKQEISQADIEAVVEVLKSDFLTQGPVVPAFEMAITQFCGVKHGVAVNSATAALHLACMALGVGKGDLVWTSPITFVASANCARYCGADVDFVDIDPRTYNMSVTALTEKLKKAEHAGKLPKVVIPVHLAGQSCEMKEIHALSEKYGFRIIEDASHAIGGRYLGEPVGNCRYSDITVFSFHPVKIITTGEGGMALTNNSELAYTLAHLRSHGITRNAGEMTQHSDGPWFYQQLSLGYNFRMTDIQAALGLSQMKQLEAFVSKRHEIAKAYTQLLTEDWIQMPWQHPDTYSALHLFVIRIKREKGVISHLELFERLRNEGILVNLHYIPVYKHPYYQKIGYNPAEYPAAENYYAEAISLPIYTTLTTEQQKEVVDTITKPMGFQNIF